tara:strand:+ start:1894 stop:2322 length:429 start_codon:yes stop_codon:yes gene_type:complete
VNKSNAVVTQNTNSDEVKSASRVVSISDPEAEVTPGQGKWLRIHLDLDTRTCDPPLTKGPASELLNMLFSLSRAKKAGDEIQVADEEGNITSVKVTKTVFKEMIELLRAPLLEAGATDRRTNKKEKVTVAATAVIFPSLKAS